DDITQIVWYDEVALLMLGTEPTAEERRAQIVDFSSGRELLPALPSGTDRIAGSVVAEAIWVGTVDDELLRSDREEWAPVDQAGHAPSFYCPVERLLLTRSAGPVLPSPGSSTGPGTRHTASSGRAGIGPWRTTTDGARFCR